MLSNPNISFELFHIFSWVLCCIFILFRIRLLEAQKGPNTANQYFTAVMLLVTVWLLRDSYFHAKQERKEKEGVVVYAIGISSGPFKFRV